MAVSARAKALGTAGTLLAAALCAPNSLAAEGYEIGNVPLANSVTTSTVVINVTGPTTASVIRSPVTLNGQNINYALLPDGTPGSLRGTIPLQIGTNTFQVFASKTSSVPVATYVIERVTPPAIACSSIPSLTGFPIQPSGSVGGTTISSAVLTAAGGGLPEHCRVQGITQLRTGTDGVTYGNNFDVRLPTVWNGRFLFTGGGGTEGSVPNATGGLAQGFATATQNGGHQNAELTSKGKTTLDFFLEPSAFQAYANGSIDKTYQTAQYLISSYYGRPAGRNYYTGCSTGGRQGMVFSQQFPTYFDGIIAGDPVYNLPAITMSEVNALQSIAAVDTVVAAGPQPNGFPRYNLSFNSSDQTLVTNALMAACDALDGTVDGVIDNLAACSFDPATFVFPSAGAYGAIAPGQPLQCTGAKTPTCLSASQVTAIKKIERGPRTSLNDLVFTTNGMPVQGYPYDGGWMETNSGIPTRNIGTGANPGNVGLGTNQIPYYLDPPDPSFIAPLQFNFDTDPQRELVNNPLYNDNLDISVFKNRGGKLIFYHGASDPGPSVQYTTNYYNALAAVNGGIPATQNFARFFPIPNMGHCSGGPATGTFDAVTPLVNWVENGIAPDSIPASGTGFRSTAGTVTGLPTSRSRLLCPYPMAAKHMGGSLALSSNYACVQH